MKHLLNFGKYLILLGAILALIFVVGTKPIFNGDVIVGPKITIYQFTAPAAGGDYFFICDVHPPIMTGKFVVTP